MEEQLREYGLSEKEAKVYVACLKLGSSTANRISKAASLRRSTTYDLLDSLKEKGLISSFLREKKHYYQSVDPSDFVVYAQEKVDRLKRILPELQRIKATAVQKPCVELFEGFEGVIALLDVLYKEKEILVYGSAEKAYYALKHLPEVLARRRAELGIRLRAVLERSPYATFRIRDPQIKKVTTMRFLEAMRNVPSFTFVSGDQVGILCFEQDLIGILITNKEMSQSQRIVFETLWRQARP